MALFWPFHCSPIAIALQQHARILSLVFWLKAYSLKLWRKTGSSVLCCPMMLRSLRLLYLRRPMRISKVDSLVLGKPQLNVAPLSVNGVPGCIEHYKDNLVLIVRASQLTLACSVLEAPWRMTCVEVQVVLQLRRRERERCTALSIKQLVKNDCSKNMLSHIRSGRRSWRKRAEEQILEGTLRRLVTSLKDLFIPSPYARNTWGVFSVLLEVDRWLLAVSISRLEEKEGTTHKP